MARSVVWSNWSRGEERGRRKCGAFSSFRDAATGPIGQIPKGRQNDFDLERKHPWKGNRPSRRVFPPDIFVILAPRLCHL